MRCFFILLTFALLPAGCMQTRHVEACSASRCDCSSSSESSVYSERKWFGIWPFQPARIQP